jgi:hypothetical protein
MAKIGFLLGKFEALLRRTSKKFLYLKSAYFLRETVTLVTQRRSSLTNG